MRKNYRIKEHETQEMSQQASQKSNKIRKEREGEWERMMLWLGKETVTIPRIGERFYLLYDMSSVNIIPGINACVYVCLLNALEKGRDQQLYIQKDISPHA